MCALRLAPDQHNTAEHAYRPDGGSGIERVAVVDLVGRLKYGESLSTTDQASVGLDNVAADLDDATVQRKAVVGDAAGGHSARCAAT